MGHSTSVVTSDAHPLGQQVLAEKDAKEEKNMTLEQEAH